MTPLKEILEIENNPPPGASSEPVLIDTHEYWYFPESGAVEPIESSEPEPDWLSQGPDGEFDETERY